MRTARDYPVTVRLSAHEKAALEGLAAAWHMDKSAVLRRLLQEAQPRPRTLPLTGHFVTAQTTLTIRLRKDRHEQP